MPDRTPRPHPLLAAALVAGLLAPAAGATGPPDPGRADTLGDSSRSGTPWRYAPPGEELDAAAERWATRRRTLALVILGTTLAAGALAGLHRRRARHRARHGGAGGPGERGE